MNKILENNLEAFKKRYPKLKEEIETLLWNEKNKRLNTGVERVEDMDVLYTEKEGRRVRLSSMYSNEWILNLWCDQMNADTRKKTYILFGFGNGMFLRKLLERREMGCEYLFIVYEPDTSILSTVISYYDISDIISEESVFLYINGLQSLLFIDALNQSMDLRSIKGTFKAYYLNYPVIYKEEFEKFNDMIDLELDMIRATMQVNIRYGEKNYNNILSNIKNLINSNSLESLREKTEGGFPAIIVSSGPSLSKNIGELKKAKGKCLMIAVDSALPVLFAEDIQPDIYMCLDANKPVTHFQQERTKESAVVTVMETIPGAIKKDQAVYFFLPDNKFLQLFFEEEGVKLPELKAGGTVAHGAYALADYLGASTIIFVGQDLAYTGEKAHADNNLSDNNDIDEKTIIWTVDINGDPIRSSREFRMYKNWFETEIHENHERIKTIDATEGGAYIEGSILMTLREAIEKECVKEISFGNVLDSCPKLLNKEQKERFIRHLGRLPEFLREIISDSEKAIRNYDRIYSLAGMNRIYDKGIPKILKENDELSKRIDENPALPFVEYHIQEEIKKLSENTFVEKKDVREELMDASILGKEHSMAILEKARWVLKDIEDRIEEWKEINRS